MSVDKYYLAYIVCTLLKALALIILERVRFC